MLAKMLLNPIFENESLTRGLGDPEARMLVEWLVEQAEKLARAKPGKETVSQQIQRLCYRGRTISRFVMLWCYQEEWGAAGQLAVTERFAWSLPFRHMDPCELMGKILSAEAMMV